MKIKASVTGGSPGVVHYAWVILAVAFALQAVGSALRMVFGVFVEPLADTFGWSRGAIGLAYSLQFISSAVFSPVVGWLSEVYGVRRALAAGVVLFTVGMVLTGTVTQLWQFYLYHSLLVGAALAMLAVPLVTAVTNWFRTRQGLAIGVLMAALGFGPALAAPATMYLIRSIGWGPAFMILGGASGAAMLGLTVLFYTKPADKNLTPFGAGVAEPVAPRSDRAVDKARTAAFFRRARATVNFWNLANVHFLGCVGHSIIIVYVASMAIERGIHPVAAAGVVGAFAGSSAVTRFLTPVMADHISPKLVMAVSYFIQGVTVLMLLNATTVETYYVFAFIFGVGYGGEGTIFPLLNKRYYRDAPMGTAYGWQLFGAGLGMALGGWIGGFLFDLTGAYTLTIIVSAATSLLGMVSIFLLADPNRGLIPDWDQSARLDTAAATATD